MIFSRFPLPWPVAWYLGAMVIGVVLTVGVASIFCLLVEQPSQRLARRIKVN